MIHVRHHHLELVVSVHPGDQAAFEHFGALADHFLEMLEALGRVPVHADQHMGGQGQAELLTVEQGHLAGDVAVVLKLLDPSRAGRGGQADALGQFLVGNACVVLQFGQDAQVIAVEFAHVWRLLLLIS